MLFPAISSANVIRFPCCRGFAITLLSPRIRMMLPHFPSSSASASSPQISTLTTTPATAIDAKPKPWLLVGLGNPGKLYQGTRHNVGFEMLDALAEAEGISMSSVSFKALFGKGHIGNVPVMLAKPQTFMNASGESVGSIVSYYKIPLKQVVVIFDDMDLPFATLRLLPKGGHGGHNGSKHLFGTMEGAWLLEIADLSLDELDLETIIFDDKQGHVDEMKSLKSDILLGTIVNSRMRSIIAHFKESRDFPRLRIGIGRPPGKMATANFVLRRFDRKEREELDFTLQNGVEALRILLLNGFEKSATFVNTKKSMEQLG